MKAITTALAAAIVLTLASSSLALDPMTRQIIVGWTKCMAERYGVDENFCLGVAKTESGTSNQEFRTGLMGKTYYGPFGIHKCFLSKWRIDDLCTNIEVGCRALRGPQDRVLHRYNASYTQDYGKAVRLAQKAYRREK